MSWIRTVVPDDADPELARAYDRVRDPESGQLDHIMQVHSLHVAGLHAHYGLYAAVMRGTRRLRKVDREMIALVVSLENECRY